MVQRPLRPPGGFTLVEVMVAIAALALLAVMSWRGLDAMVRTQEATRKQGEQQAVFQTVLAQWNADLNALMPLEQTQTLDWDGQVLRLTRKSSNPVVDEGAWVVAWSRRTIDGQMQWTRWQSAAVRTRGQWLDAWTQAAQSGRSNSSQRQSNEVALFPLDQWRIYYYRDNAWTNPQSSDQSNQAPGGKPPSSASNASAIQTLPDGIRIELSLPAGNALSGPVTIDWVNPLRNNARS